MRLEIADFVHLELAAEKRGVGLVADADEHSVTRLYGFFSLHHVLDFHPGYRALRRVQNVRDHRIPDELDLLVAPHPVLHDLGGPQLITTVNDRNLGGIAGEEQRLFRRRVTATHNHDGLAAEEVAVASGAGGDAVTQQLALGLQTDHLS